MKGIIYMYLNNINNKVYIGQTIQTKNCRSGKDGKRYLRKNEKGEFKHKKFALAILKYGWENFSYTIIETCDRELLNEREKFWIATKDSFNNGYNSTPGGDYIQYHKKLTEETKLKISLNSKRSIPILMIDIKTNQIIKEFTSITSAAKFLNISASTPIKNACKYNKPSLGYIWKYKDLSIPVKIKENNKSKNKIKKASTKNKQYRKSNIFQNIKCKHIIQFDLDFNYIKEYDSIRAAANELNIAESNIRRALDNTNRSAAGYKWKTFVKN